MASHSMHKQLIFLNWNIWQHTWLLVSLDFQTNKTVDTQPPYNQSHAIFVAGVLVIFQKSLF